MKPSNTAIPKYYGEFREQVINGEILVNENISKQMNRIDDLIASPYYYYDLDAVEGFIAFCESELTLTDGTDLDLLDTFKLWGENIFGWYFYKHAQVYEYDPIAGEKRYVNKIVKQRLTLKFYLIMPRGGAKSVFLYCVHSYTLIIDRTATHQITTAPTMKQAEEVMGPFRTAIQRARGPMFKFLTYGSLQNTTGNAKNRPQLYSSKKGVEYRLTNSFLEIRPMSIDKLQGLRCKYATVDEWLSGDVRENVIGAIEQGASKLDDYLILATSSEGTIRNGSGDDIKMELMAILNGEYIDDRTAIWHYQLDDIKEIADPDMWEKAQPNLDKTVSRDVYIREVERAEQVPSARNDIVAKRFGIPVEGWTYFFTYDETLPTERLQNFDGQDCIVGGDFSQGDDYCAFTATFKCSGERLGIKVRAYITEKTLFKLPPALRAKYDQFIHEGTLVVMPGVVLDMRQVYHDYDEYILRHKYNPLLLAYDRYNSDIIVKLWAEDYGEDTVVPIRQGAMSETVPLGELKKLAEEGLLIFDEYLLSFCMGNAITMEDNKGNRKLMRRRSEQKIDNVAALINAYIMHKMLLDDFM